MFGMVQANSKDDMFGMVQTDSNDDMFGMVQHTAMTACLVWFNIQQ